MTAAFRRQRQEDEDVAEAGELKASLATMRPYLKEHFKKSWENMCKENQDASDHTKNS